MFATYLRDRHFQAQIKPTLSKPIVVMSPLPTLTTVAINGNSIYTWYGWSPAPLHHLSKRTNWNPLHYATLPVKNNWSKVAPVLNTYNKYMNTVSIILGGLALLAFLDSRNWKLPRWPWAKDGKNHPKPSVRHQNENMTVDDLAEMKIMEMLKEMKMHEGLEDIPWEEDKPTETEDESEKEAEEEFIEDAEAGIGDVMQEMEMEGPGFP